MFTMSNRKLQDFLDAFTALPYKVIWKMDNLTLPDIYKDKIYVGKWFSQLDILCKYYFSCFKMIENALLDDI